MAHISCQWAAGGNAGRCVAGDLRAILGPARTKISHLDVQGVLEYRYAVPAAPAPQLPILTQVDGYGCLDILRYEMAQPVPNPAGQPPSVAWYTNPTLRILPEVQPGVTEIDRKLLSFSSGVTRTFDYKVKVGTQLNNPRHINSQMAVVFTAPAVAQPAAGAQPDQRLAGGVRLDVHVRVHYKTRA